jgi:hypothetical protein
MCRVIYMSTSTLLMISIFFLSNFYSEASTATATTFPSFSQKEVSNFSFNQLQAIRFSYVRFLKESEKDLLKNKSASYKFKLIDSAYAAIKEDGDLCFFGGWESTIVNGRCAKPPLGFSAANCEPGQFECNPSLFPSSPGKGACTEVKPGFANLTDDCDSKTSVAIPDLKKNMNSDELSKMSGKIKQFCDKNPSYDACANLATRLKNITSQQIGDYEKPTTDTNTDQPVNNNPNNKNDTNPVAAGPSIGDKMLKACNSARINEGIDGGQSLLGLACGNIKTAGFNTKANFDAISTALAKQTLANNTVNEAMKQSLRALVSSEIQFTHPPTIPLRTEKDFRNYLANQYPELKKNPSFEATLKSVYQEMNTKVKDGKLLPFEPLAVANQFNDQAKIVNDLCKKIHDESASRIGEIGAVHRWVNQYVYKSDSKEQFILTQKKKLDQALNQFQTSAVASSMMATDYFKDNVFDSSVDYGEQCTQNPSYIPIKPIRETEIKKGAAGLRTVLAEGLKKLNDQQKLVASNQVDQFDSVIKQFVKNDPSLLYYTMKQQGSGDQKNSAAVICSSLLDVLKSDKNWLIADRIIGGVGAVVGVALLCTGVGSPLGGVLFAASVGGGTYDIARAVQNKKEANRAADSAEQQLARGAASMSNFADMTSESARNTRNAYLQGGLGVLTIAPVFKVKVAYEALNAERGVSSVSKALPMEKQAAKALNSTKSAGAKSPPQSSLNTGATTTENTVPKSLNQQIPERHISGKAGGTAEPQPIASTTNKGSKTKTASGARTKPKPPKPDYSIINGAHPKDADGMLGNMRVFAVAVKKLKNARKAQLKDTLKEAVTNQGNSIKGTLEKFGGKENYIKFLRAQNLNDEADEVLEILKNIKDL